MKMKIDQEGDQDEQRDQQKTADRTRRRQQGTARLVGQQIGRASCRERV